MAFSTAIKRALNAVLARAGLRLDTLTAERAERRRLADLDAAGHFERAVFPIPGAFLAMDDAPVRAALARHAEAIDRLSTPERNAVGYRFDNEWFGSPDAEVLYAMVRETRPATLLEVGSGHSTRVARQAILDGGLATRIVCIDPHPRAEIGHLADEVHREPFGAAGERGRFEALERGDVLFVDSSHEIRAGNDVTAIFLDVVPRLAAGVLVHVHDVFLPFEYPRRWLVEERWPWAEQYLVQALLGDGEGFEVLWAGHWLQRTRADFAAAFPHLGAGTASSLWLRRRREPRRR